MIHFRYNCPCKYIRVACIRSFVLAIIEPGSKPNSLSDITRVYGELIGLKYFVIVKNMGWIVQERIIVFLKLELFPSFI